MEETRTRGHAERYAALCADVLRTFVARFRSEMRIRLPSDRGQTVTALERALAQRVRRVAMRRRVTRAAVASAALAACVLLASGWRWSRRPGGGADGALVRAGNGGDHAFRVLDSLSAEPVPEGAVVIGDAATRRPLHGGITLGPGTGLVAPQANEIRIGTADGTILTLEKASELRVLEQSAVQRLSLKGGAVRAHVAKLQPKERFIIDTDDAEIEVHGTVFRVAMVAPDSACGDGLRTRVSVFEGMVSVRASGGEALIPAGGEWPPGCSTRQAAAVPNASAVGTSSGAESARSLATSRSSQPSVPVSAGPLATSGGRERWSEPGNHRVPGSSSRSAARDSARSDFAAGIGSTAVGGDSTLAAQNDLFLEAIRARRQERIDAAIRLFSRLIDTYPDGPLVEGAMAQRMSLLRSIGGTSATRAAAQYLVRFPGGFARTEARSLLGSTP